jgi:hypothetical protein
MAASGHADSIRLELFLAGAALLFVYGALLNIAPIQFGRVVSLYIATLFVVWQVINAAAFCVMPTMPVLSRSCRTSRWVLAYLIGQR